MGAREFEMASYTSVPQLGADVATTLEKVLGRLATWREQEVTPDHPLSDANLEGVSGAGCMTFVDSCGCSNNGGGGNQGGNGQGHGGGGGHH